MNSYQSLVYFDPNMLKPCSPHSIVIHSGKSNYLNYKAPTMLSLLSGRYCINKLRNKFNSNISPSCKICHMNTTEYIPHFILYCPYLDGACRYILLLWSNRSKKCVYNHFTSAIQNGPCDKVIK